MRLQGARDRRNGAAGRTVPVKSRKAISLAVAAGVPTESIALYTRWWQLEIWLRQLSYLVLRSLWGAAWETEVHKKAAHYAANDNLIHLVGPDQPDLLGYLDFGLLVKLIGDNWQYFGPFLLERSVWDGRIKEMSAIRNRVGHVRRAGLRDRSRVEHLLEDLEPGFRKVLTALAADFGTATTSRGGDPIVANFLTGDLFQAAEHVRRKYKFDVELGLSSMPWAQVPQMPLPFSKTSGLVWHLSIGGPDRWVDLSKLEEVFSPVREQFIYIFVSSPGGAQIAVPVVDDNKDVLKMLKYFIDYFPSCTVPIHNVTTAQAESWPGSVEDLDSRLLVEHLFAIAVSADETGSIFRV